MDDKVHIPVVQYWECSSRNLAFFSTQGLVILQIFNILFDKLSYSVATSVTGTSSLLICSIYVQYFDENVVN